jgi:hypothetical protein
MKENLNHLIVPELLNSISKIITDACKRVAQTINSELIVTYWYIGKEIVEKERKRMAKLFGIESHTITYQLAFYHSFSILCPNRFGK